MEYLTRIKAKSDVVLSVSSGGGTGMTVAQRLEGVLRAKPELATLNMGSMNYGGFTMIDKYRGKWKFDWEEPYLEQTRRDPFLSTYTGHRIHAHGSSGRRPAPGSSARPTTRRTCTRLPTTSTRA